MVLFGCVQSRTVPTVCNAFFIFHYMYNRSLRCNELQNVVVFFVVCLAYICQSIDFFAVGKLSNSINIDHSIVAFYTAALNEKDDQGIIHI